MQLISIGNLIINLDHVSALDIDRELEGSPVLRVLADTNEPIATVKIADDVLDLLLGLVPAKQRFVGLETVKHSA